MALTSIGNLGTSLTSFYQSISGGTQSSTLTSTWNPQAAAEPDTSAADQTVQRLRHNYDESFQQIEQAVNDALNAARQEPTADPNQIIQDSIQQAFQTSGDGSTAGTNSTSAGGSTSDSSEAGQTDPNTSAATQSFLRTLRTYGVDPQQFHSDLVAAVKDAQQGNVDPSTVLRNFPVGSNLDAVA